MFVIRRTLYCKVAQAGPALALAREVIRLVQEMDESVKAQRLYTDLSGRTDRIIIESETEQFVHPREITARVHAHPDAGRVFGQLGPLLERAETDFYVLEQTA